MKASRFSDAQKAFILKQGADGMPVADICRKAGISQATYFNWKKKYDGLLPTEMRRLKQLEAAVRWSLISASTRRCCRTHSAENFEVCPERRACRCLLDTSTYHYKSRRLRTGRPRTAHPRDLPDARALRLSAGSHPVAA
jgi:Transposase